MDGLEVEEHSTIYQSNPNNLFSKNVDGNSAKTPRRGLGLMVNASKTPRCRAEPSVFQSITQKTSNVPIFEVFEDISDKEGTTTEDKEEEKLCSSPIETASRLSLGHNSFEMLEDGIDSDILHDDLPQLNNEPQQETQKCSLANLNMEEWEEYQPIEKVSGLNNCIENFEDLYPIDDVSLFHENEENSIWVPHGEMVKQWTREEIYYDSDECEFEDEENIV